MKFNEVFVTTTRRKKKKKKSISTMEPNQMTHLCVLVLLFMVTNMPAVGQHIEGDKWINSPYCGLDTMSSESRSDFTSSSASRISSGFAALPGQYPYFVQLAISIKENGTTLGYTHGCGAVIIHPRVLLTAAHCLLNPLSGQPLGLDRLTGLIRSVDRLGGPPPGVYFEHSVSHPQYKGIDTIEYDLALLFVNKTHRISEILNDGADNQLYYPDDDDNELIEDQAQNRPPRPLANTVCLPENDDTQFGEYATYETMGYGRVSDELISQPIRTLQGGRVRTASPTAKRAGVYCGNQVKDINCDPELVILIHSRHPERTNICHGDSGGPLVHIASPLSESEEIEEEEEGYEGRPRATLAGIASGGMGGCNSTDAVSYFGRVTHFMPWIVREVNKFLDSSD